MKVAGDVSGIVATSIPPRGTNKGKTYEHRTPVPYKGQRLGVKPALLTTHDPYLWLELWKRS